MPRFDRYKESRSANGSARRELVQACALGDSALGGHDSIVINSEKVGEPNEVLDGLCDNDGAGLHLSLLPGCL